MEHEAARIADLQSMIIEMRRELEEQSQDRIEMSNPAIRHMHVEIARLEQALRDLGVDP